MFLSPIRSAGSERPDDDVLRELFFRAKDDDVQAMKKIVSARDIEAARRLRAHLLSTVEGDDERAESADA